MPQDQRAGTIERLEADNARLREQLDGMRHEFDEFLYVVSHDLKEPLRTIKSFSTLILRDGDTDVPETTRRYLGVIDDGARRLEHLLDDLLALSRVGRKSPPSEDMGLDELLDEAQVALTRLIAERDAVITFTGPRPTVCCAREEIAWVLRELLENAIKFNKATPPEVHVSVDDRGDAWEVSVRDNGIGVDPKYSDKLFRLFYRNVRREDYEGTGAGLTICKRMVERHGGRIWLRDGQEGVGSTFAFTLPKRSPLT